ncbi:MAG: ABC transporter substrate binding protein [Pseudolabrys sp.]
MGQWGAISSAAPALGVEVSPVNVRDAPEIERGVAAFARSGDGGLIVTGSPLSLVHRELIIALAARHKLPTVCFVRPFVTDGGLFSYGPDVVDQSRRAAGYVDRILKGENPPTCRCRHRPSMVINLKTATTLGLTMPPSVLARADEVIE